MAGSTAIKVKFVTGLPNAVLLNDASLRFQREGTSLPQSAQGHATLIPPNRAGGEFLQAHSATLTLLHIYLKLRFTSVLGRVDPRLVGVD